MTALAVHWRIVKARPEWAVARPDRPWMVLRLDPEGWAIHAYRSTWPMALKTVKRAHEMGGQP